MIFLFFLFVALSSLLHVPLIRFSLLVILLVIWVFFFFLSLCPFHSPKRSVVVLPLPDVGPFREVSFNFITDGSEARRGFYIEFIQEFCPNPSTVDQTHGISYSVVPSSASHSPVSPSSSSLRSIDPPAVRVSLDPPLSKMGSHEYPTNYVAKAQIEQIVEAQVRVIDSKDGLSLQQVQVSGTAAAGQLHPPQTNATFVALGG